MKAGTRAIIIRDDKLLVVNRYNHGEHYYALVGGSLDPGETKEQALVREIEEETGLNVIDFQHVFTEDLGEKYGMQYVFLCQDPGGEPVLSPESIEAKLNRGGDNTFELIWVPITNLPGIPLMSPKMKAAIIDAVKNTFPNQPVDL